MMTTVVNLWAGPGVGKSTNAALTFGKLKVAGISVELVTEYAKDLVWEERHQALGFQPYLSSKQIWRIQRLIGKVDVVITDSPILLSLIYGDELEGTAFSEYLWEMWNSWDKMNIKLIRNDEHHPFVATGRTQKNVGEAERIDQAIDEFIYNHWIPVKPIEVRAGEATADKMTELIKEHIRA